jgi:hypothetical protein
MTRLFQIVTWLALLAIAAATLSPLGLRPRLASANVSFEHLAAYAFVGLMSSLAYPRHIWPAASTVLVAAFGLEAWQMLTPDRHARLADALQKAGGGFIGLSLGWLAAQFWRRSRT